MTDLEFLNQKGHGKMRLPDYEGEPQEDRWEPVTLKEEEMERPQFVEEEHLEFLDELAESGLAKDAWIIALHSRRFLGLSKQEVDKLMSYWIKVWSKNKEIPYEFL